MVRLPLAAAVGALAFVALLQCVAAVAAEAPDKKGDLSLSSALSDSSTGASKPTPNHGGRSLEIFSEFIGWVYTVAWSASFWPQIYMNWRRKSVTGMSFEFQAYNITGFVLYTVYSIAKYVTQHRYHLKSSVEINDLVFVTHAVLMTSITIGQCIVYKLDSHKLNRWHLYIICGMWLLVAYNLAICAGGVLPFVNTHAEWEYTVVEFFGYVKAAISFIKYCPQAYMNWSRQSTRGFAIGGILLDLTGGLTSFAQQSIDAYRTEDWGQFTSNVAKLLLSWESIAFDVLFICQHYILYRKNNAALAAQAAALGATAGGQLSREEEEALEHETLAKAKRPDALLPFGKRGTDSGADNGTSSSSSHGAYDSMAPTTPATAHVLHRINSGSSNGNGNSRRGSDSANSHTQHLLQQPAYDSNNQSVF